MDYPEQLTATEGKIFRLLVEGKRPFVIQNELGIAENTIRSHCKRIYEKLKVDSQVALVIRYRKQIEQQAKLDEIDYDLLLRDLDEPNVLLPREFQVAEQIAYGKRLEVISAKLNISRLTTIQYAHRIRKKIGISTNEELTEWFLNKYPDVRSRVIGYVRSCIAHATAWNENHNNEGRKKQELVKPFAVKEKIMGVEKPEDTLTSYELRMCALIATKTKDEVCAALKIKHGTFRTYFWRITLKNSCKNYQQVALWFIRKYPTPDAIEEAIRQAEAREKKVRVAKSGNVLKTLGK